ncbi:MAG: hypothetical protein AMK69_15985 [Nitrospira bacterium SG8_3]|nr:MAG: hypothetical protein AMK69_15985 [Nitrospira bacterium SG8_3]
MKRIRVFIKAIFLVVLAIFLQRCATQTVSIEIENSLPQSKLAYYNDSFDKLREDLWEKAGFTFSQAQLRQFRAADLTIEDGVLRIKTKTGGFSKGGLVSKYKLGGDFDVQVECHMDFLVGKQDMDQVLGFGIVERGKKTGEMRGIFLGLLKRGESGESIIHSNYGEKGKFHPGNWHRTGDFYGTLRFVRTGHEISTLYKKQGEKQWRKLNTFPSTRNDAIVGFALQNFIVKRNSITAKSSIIAKFDNFKINAAQEIIEEEI